MINSQAISLSQKKKLWKEQKQEKFREISNDRCQMFNYFYNNNDIFKFIAPEDFGYYSYLMLDMMDRQANLFIGSVVGVFLVDRYAVSKLFPNIRFQKWRLTANVIKFLIWPSIIFNVVDQYYNQTHRSKMLQIQQKYHFGFQDYVRGNKILERALEANRLEELLEKREGFDWKGIPQLQ